MAVSVKILDLGKHRTATPIDHPDRSVTRSKLEYPTVDVPLVYLYIIGKAFVDATDGNRFTFIRTVDNFTDKAIVGVQLMKSAEAQWYEGFIGRAQADPRFNSYVTRIETTKTTSDVILIKFVSVSEIILGSQAVDLSDDTAYIYGISCSGSTLKAVRFDRWYAFGGSISWGTATVAASATDTSFSSGGFAERVSNVGGPGETAAGFKAFLKAPYSSFEGAKAVIELDVDGDGTAEKPFTPAFSRNVTTGNRDLDAVTWGMIDFAVDQATGRPVQYLCHVCIYGDNPYKPGAIQRQVEHARSKNRKVFTPPLDYRDIYRYIKKVRPEILITENELVYQIVGAEELEIDAVADFYERELIDLNRIRGVPEWELESTISMWIERGKRFKRDRAVEKLMKVRRR